MRKTMRILLAFLFSALIVSGCSTTGTLTHEIDNEATALARCKIGETITKDIHLDNFFLANSSIYTKFLGITTQGYYLVQQFYTDQIYSDDNTKRTDPFLLICPDKMEDEDKFWKACEIIGHHIGWHLNGQKFFEGFSPEGKAQGLWKGWLPNGEKLLEDHYLDGKLHGIGTVWYPNGEKLFEYHYHEDKRQGLGTVGYINGNKRNTGLYHDDKEWGLWTFWHENGQKSKEGYFRDGKEIGLWIEWDENGKEISRKEH